MALQDSITAYEKRTGETFTHAEGLELKIIGDEFMLWQISDKWDGSPCFCIDQVYAKSFSVFVDFIKEICEQANIEFIVTISSRDPKSHIRKWKMERLAHKDYDFRGKRYYVFKSHISNLK